jgi:CubicO group peptidase (beta-lactamase class C family)
MIDQKRFDELAAKHDVPGAVLAVSIGDELHELATGVLNLATGVETTTDSLFQIASITKPYTATMIVRLVQQGLLTLDTRVVEVLPDFRVADPEVTAQVTVRHLLTHTSGIAGDFFHDSGRGDDALERFVADCADLGQDTPLGATLSYSNTGYNILGRIIEVLTGETWDQALHTLVTEPLGLTHTWTLPEEVLRFRAAMGHCVMPGQESLAPTPMWEPGFRGEGPAGAICATGADVIAFARLHMADPTLAVMREPQVAPASPLFDHWGLGWNLWSWDGFEVFGHSGDVPGQSCRLLVVPEDRFAVVVLTNVDDSRGFQADLLSELLSDFCDIRMPGRPTPPASPASPVVLGDIGGYAGSFERVGSRVDIIAGGDGLTFRFTPLGLMAEFMEPFGFPLIPLSDRLFVGRESDTAPWTPVVIEDDFVHFGLRAYLRTQP